MHYSLRDRHRVCLRHSFFCAADCSKKRKWNVKHKTGSHSTNIILLSSQTDATESKNTIAFLDSRATGVAHAGQNSQAEAE